jgi:hypothetical protein
LIIASHIDAFLYFRFGFSLSAPALAPYARMPGEHYHSACQRVSAQSVAAAAADIFEAAASADSYADAAISLIDTPMLFAAILYAAAAATISADFSPLMPLIAISPCHYASDAYFHDS